MDPLSSRRHRFPPPIIQQAIWRYLRFTLSYRDVEELLAERGLEVSYETDKRAALRLMRKLLRKLGFVPIIDDCQAGLLRSCFSALSPELPS